MRPRLRLLVALLAPVFLAVSWANAQISANFGGASGGSVIPGNDSNTCSSTNNGAIRYTGSQFQVCYGSGGWAALPDASGTVAGLSSDRITSGTAGVFVSNTGVINFRTGGITTGYFDASGLLVAPGISITTANGISSTNGYFSGNIGLGTTAPLARIHVYDSQNGALEGLRLVNANSGNSAHSIARFYNNSGSAGAGFYFNSTTRTVDGGGSAFGFYNDLGSIKFRSNVGDIQWATGSGVSDTTRILIKNNGRVGIGIATPTTELEVSGTISATAFIGDGSGLTNLNVQGDRITSGTAGVFVSDTGIINLRTSGVTTGYFDASGLLVIPGISITTANGISSTNGYFSNTGYFVSNTTVLGSLGVGTSSPKTKLDIGTSSMKLGGDGQYIGFNMYYDGTLWRNSAANVQSAMIRIGQASTGEAGDIQFTTNNSPTASTLADDALTIAKRMIIRRAGDVRLGSMYVGSTSITPTTSLEVSGTVSATAFVGNGSGLTGLSAGDRITSGTAGVFVSNTGIINFRTGGVTTGYFDASGLLVAPGINVTTGNGISSTSGYFSTRLNVNSTSSDGSNLVTVGSAGNAFPNISLWRDASNETTLGFKSGLNSGTSATAIRGMTSGGLRVTDGSGAIEYTRIVSSGVGIATSANPSATLHVAGNAITTSWTMINASRLATAPLEVSGTVSATAFVGNGSGLTGLTGDRITSGTAGVFVSNTGIINFRTGGVTTGYFDTAGVLVAPGISLTTSGISSTNGYFSGALITAPRDNASTSINWAQGNVQRTSSSCGAFTFTNMQDGGAYTLTIEGTTAGTCSFSHSGLTFRMPPDHGAVSTGTMTLYTFLRSGTNVFVNWTPGY